jgi:hypothetical protein
MFKVTMPYEPYFFVTCRVSEADDFVELALINNTREARRPWSKNGC